MMTLLAALSVERRRPAGQGWSLVAGLGIVAVVVTGCGSTTPGSSAAAPGNSTLSGTGGTVLTAAYTATTGAHSARVQIRTSVQATGTGASLNSTGTTDGTLNLASGDRDFITQLPTGGQTESRQIGGVLYSKIAVLGGTPPAKPWIKITVTGAAAARNFNDPTQTLTYLRGAARSVTNVGTEQVRGVNTTHYKAQIDLAKLTAEAGPSPAPGQPDRGAMLRRLLGTDTLPVEVWVDAQQRIRRLTSVSPFLSGSSSGTTGSPGTMATPTVTPTRSGTATITEEYYDFGTPVNIQAPPPDQVQTAPAGIIPAPAPPAPVTPTPGPVPSSIAATITS